MRAVLFAVWIFLVPPVEPRHLSAAIDLCTRGFYRYHLCQQSLVTEQATAIGLDEIGITQNMCSCYTSAGCNSPSVCQGGQTPFIRCLNDFKQAVASPMTNCTSSFLSPVISSLDVRARQYFQSMIANITFTAQFMGEVLGGISGHERLVLQDDGTILTMCNTTMKQVSVSHCIRNIRNQAQHRFYSFCSNQLQCAAISLGPCLELFELLSMAICGCQQLQYLAVTDNALDASENCALLPSEILRTVPKTYQYCVTEPNSWCQNFSQWWAQGI